MAQDPRLTEAVKILSEATNFDKNGSANDALLQYTLGVEKLVSYHKTLTADDPKKKAIGERIAQYLDRAEELKGQVEILEQRQITADSTGHSYEAVFSKCINDKLTAVYVQDAYIVAHHQILNFVRFCEMLVRQAKNIRIISLTTSTNAKTSQEAFDELGSSLRSREIQLIVKYEENLHDREIRFNNGWIVKIGRGLDYFKPQGKYAIGACDMNQRKCHPTTIDIFKVKLG